MSDLLDAATAVLLSAEQRAKAAAQNIANTNTAGFKRQMSFTELLHSVESGEPTRISMQFVNDFSQGQLVQSGDVLDLAIVGPALLRLRAGDEFIYARGGSFRRSAEGILVDGSGHVLQAEGSGDIALTGDLLEILDDGTILEDGIPTARIGLFETSAPDGLKALGGTAYAAEDGVMAPATNSSVRSGFLEKSNVVSSDEMIAMMGSVRQAEGGARIVQTYDQLIGQAISTFTRSQR